MTRPKDESPPDLAQLRAKVGTLQREGQHDAALEALGEPWDGEPREFALARAISLRHLGRIEDALSAIARIEPARPAWSLLFQERGLCHIARKDAGSALRALREAVNINPALTHSWRMIEGVSRLVGDDDGASFAAAQLAALRALPAEVVSATSLFADGALDEAEAKVRAFLLQNGDHPEAMRLLARIGMAHKVWDDAEVLLAGVLVMVPDHKPARFEYAETLAERHKFTEAEAALAPLIGAEPGNQEFRRLASTIAVGLGRQDEAIALYRAMLADMPQDPALTVARADVNLWLGHALKTVGETAPAIAAYRTAAALRPDFGDAWWSLANLKTYRFEDGELATMQAALEAPGTAEIDRIHLNFALGKALEDRGRHAGSWNAYARGNALQRAASKYRPEIIETNTRLQKQVCTAAFFAERARWGDPSADPIFVLGLPRSGSTLVEQILASHSQVEGTQELPQIQRFALELQGRDHDLDNPRYPGSLAGLTRDQAAELGARYIAETRAHRGDRPFFVDKMPNNFRHIGLIRLILPNAKIIDARREPMACCFSNLKQLFAQGQEFTYSMTDIARYYRTYLALMRHWDEVLPGAVHRVIHEDVIDDLDGTVRRLLEYCGLPFEPACLSFHETRRAVRTPSSEQVRQPIDAGANRQWMAYADWLEPLEDALGPALTTWRS